jgi:phage terminase large subunit-like protein
MTKEDKLKAIEMLAEAYDNQWPTLNSIEPRLREYIYDVATFETAHNAYEVLGAVKFLRLLRTYEIDIETFRDVVWKYEGRWEKTADGLWQHIEGGLRHPGTTGPTYYRLQPFQVFVLASMFLLKAWINTESEIGSRGIGPTEQAFPDGYIYDLRRLCTEFTDFTPRKTAKTQLSAFIQFWYFMSGDENAECYCCANASDQAKILFTRTSQLIRQMDPKERRIRFTASQVNWKPGQFRSASLTALSAGGKTKDGLFAQLCSADEYGSAAYVNGASDMGKLVSVVESSMGPRREPMTFISTTAGIIQAGPFIDKLRGIKQLLMTELDADYEHDLSTDRQMCLLLEPDEWEQQDEELLLTSKDVRRKVNPMLGVIVQHSFYDDEISKARQNPEKKNEVISKLLNVYHGGKTEEWIKPDVIRQWQDRLQREIDKGEKYASRVDQCTADKGWVVFCGMDFSMGDDLYAHGYLCVNVQTGDLLADMDAWITQETLEKISIRPLYEQWIKDGWLHVCEGGVIDTEIPVKRIITLTESGVNIMRIGFDPYRSPDPVNMLKAWVHSLGLKPDVYVVPVSQTLATYNQPVEQLTAIIKHPNGLLRFSPNPLWPYCFGCAVLEKDTRMENKKPIKRNPGSDACKVDPIQALLSAWICWNHVEGSEMPVE